MAKTWIYKTPSGKWACGYYEHGKRRSKVMQSKTQAQEYAADVMHRLNAGLNTSLVRVPWANMLAEYYNHKTAARLKPGAITEIKLTLKHFERLVGPVKSDKFTQATLDRFMQLRSTEKISSFTLNKDVANINAFVRYFSVKRPYIRPGLGLEKVKAIAKPKRALTDEQVGTLLRSLKRSAPSYYIRALLAVSGGLRLGHIDPLKGGPGLRIEDLHFDRNTIDTYSTKTGKYWMDRPMQPAVMTEISNFLADAPAGQLRMLPDIYRRKRWLELCRQAGVKTTFQNLRRTCCSLMQQKGTSVAVAAQILEHSTTRTTERWYTDVSPAVADATNTLPVGDWIEDK
jgi:integrase